MPTKVEPVYTLGNAKNRPAEALFLREAVPFNMVLRIKNSKSKCP
jgi:hypothetical protein